MRPFLAAELDVLVPEAPDGLALPPGDPGEWRTALHGRRPRTACFYDEKLVYLCRLTWRTPPTHEALAAFSRICDAVKITTQCSFITRSPHPAPHAEDAGLPPITPNPMPGFQPGQQEYAQAAGVQVWEGGLSPSDEDTPCLVVVQEDGACVAYWLGEVVLAFANVGVRDPLLAITCHATLRESLVGGVVSTGGEDVQAEPQGETLVSVGDIIGSRDVLAGLGDVPLPSRRLHKALPLAGPPTPVRPEAGTVLRKSYRSVLPLHSATTVKMRTLPALTSPAQADQDGALGSTISIEVEAGDADADGVVFLVTDLTVSTRADAERTTIASAAADTRFPFELERFSQHNLVYNIHTQPSAHPQHAYLALNPKIEHLRIDVEGCVLVHGRAITSRFTSTWNTTLELRNADLGRVARLGPIGAPPSARLSTQSKPPPLLHRDLVVSLNLIAPHPAAQEEDALTRVKVFETVDAEVTILNVSGRTVRLVLSDLETAHEGNHERVTNGIIMLQNDLTLAPLLPRACQSVRLRFMAMIQGAQRLPGFRLADFERDQAVHLEFAMFLDVV